MTQPRPVTPARPGAPVRPAAPVRLAAVSSPWDLAELPAPKVQPITYRPNSPANQQFSQAEVGQLREQMQEQQVRAVAEARRAAFEEGRVAGRAEAQQAADRRVADTVDALSTAIAAVRQHEEAYIGALEENLTTLACAIARQVIQREVQLDPSAIRELVQSALSQFPQESTLKVRLHPHDHALLAGDPGYRDITWVADPRIVRGGCVVEGRERIIDGRVDLALEQVFRVLTGLDA